MSPTDQRFSSSEFYDPTTEPQTSKNEQEKKMSVSAKAAAVEAPSAPEPETNQSSMKPWHVLTVLGLVTFYYYYGKSNSEEISNERMEIESVASDNDSSVLENEVVSLPSPSEPLPVVKEEPPDVAPKRVTFLTKDL